MERNGGALALALVCLLCCLAGGASAAYSVPADPRRQPSPGPGRGGYSHGAAPAASPRQHHHRQHGLSPAPASPHHAPSPSPTAGADGLPSHPPVLVYTRAPEPQATTTPHFGFPLEPTVGVTAGGPSGALPKKGAGSEGYPFIGSNPTVPLPTGVTDTATVRPLPDTTRADDNAKEDSNRARVEKGKKGAGSEGYPFIGSNPTVPLPTGVTDTATVRPLPDTTRADDNAKVAGRAAEPVRAGAAMIGLLMAVLSTLALLLSSWS